MHAVKFLVNGARMMEGCHDFHSRRGLNSRLQLCSCCLLWKQLMRLSLCAHWKTSKTHSGGKLANVFFCYLQINLQDKMCIGSTPSIFSVLFPHYTLNYHEGQQNKNKLLIPYLKNISGHLRVRNSCEVHSQQVIFEIYHNHTIISDYFNTSYLCNIWPPEAAEIVWPGKSRNSDSNRTHFNQDRPSCWVTIALFSNKSLHKFDFYKVG